jgi:hypothetical protein
LDLLCHFSTKSPWWSTYSCQGTFNSKWGTQWQQNFQHPKVDIVSYVALCPIPRCAVICLTIILWEPSISTKICACPIPCWQFWSSAVRMISDICVAANCWHSYRHTKLNNKVHRKIVLLCETFNHKHMVAQRNVNDCRFWCKDCASIFLCVHLIYISSQQYKMAKSAI